jgi:hypothetical protein
MARRKKAAGSVRIDLSDVGVGFKAGEEYRIKCEECTIEDGQKAPYFKLVLKGTGEHSKSTMYHNASTSDESLWRLRPLLEAFDIDIPDGPMDISPDDFVGKEAMCSTFKDTYAGGSSIKPDEFWPVEGGGSSAKEADTEGEIDLDEISDADIKKLAKALGVKGRDADKLREEIAELDDEDIQEAAEEAGIKIGEEEKPAEKGKTSAEDLQDMNEDDLEEFCEEHDLDVDLGEFRTLRKKRNAVVDAAEEAGVFAD